VTTVLTPADERAPKKRHRGRTAIIVVAIIVVLLIVAGFVLDGVARSYAAGIVRDEVRTGLSIPAAQPVDVTVGGASVLLQLAAGKLQQVDVDLPQLAIGDLTGAATLRGTGVPITQGKPIDRASLGFSTDESGLQKLLKGLSGVPVTSVTIGSGAVILGAKFTIFGIALPVKIATTPSAIDGELALTPKYAVINGAKVSVKDLASVAGGALADVVKTQKICVASLLPVAFHLDQIAIHGSTVRLAVSAKSVVLDDSLLSTKGTCP
jgi:hypothetical protein